jgi:WD40 repeat protein
MNTLRVGGSLPGAITVDPLGSGRLEGSAIADLAFGDVSVGESQLADRHLALLSVESLELDLTDPAQRQFGDYELLELIGEGGMGVVYRAHQISLDREVAVKLLAAGPWASKEFIERFRREAQNAARMQHPNIVAIYEVGSAEGLHFFSMRLIRGHSLAAVIKRDGPMPPQRAAGLLRIIAEAVDYAHRLGVLHLDLKPANMLLEANGIPHVADFGLARRLEQGLAADNDEVSGTPSYMAPEQAQVRSQKITPATDIWGLGAILYELVTGHPPFLGDSPHTTLKLVTTGALRSPRRYVPALPRDLEAIILKCMTREVANRYSSARALADDLGRFLEGRPVRAHPLNRAQRTWRWARRQPYVAALGLLFTISMLAGIIGVSSQWRRAEGNAATASERLWESRRDAALRLQTDGRGFEALSPLIANIDEQERTDKSGAARVERREVGAILNQGVVLLKRMHLADAAHASPFAVELSPDGSRFAVALTDLTVHWYDTATLHEMGYVDLLGLPDSSDAPQTPVLLRFIDNHRLRVTLDWIDFHTAPAENDTYLIDLDSGNLISPPDDFSDLSDATYSADGKYAVLRNRNTQIQFWQVDPWQPLSPLVAQDFDREVMILSRDGSKLIGIGNAQKTLSFYDPRTMALTTRIALPPTQGLSAWAESGDGRHFAFGDFQGRVFVLDATTGTLRQVPTSTGREVTWVAFSEDDAWLAAVRWDGAAYAFDVATGESLNAGQMQHDFELRRVAINHRERLLIASGLGKSGLWRLAPPGPNGGPAMRIATSPMRAAAAGPFSLDFCASNGLLITAETDGEVRLWRAPVSPVLDAAPARLLPGMLEYDGRHVVDVAYNKLRVTVPATGESTPWIELPQPVSFAELIDGGRTLIAASGTQLTIFDRATMQPRYAPIELGNSPMRLVASAGSNTAVLSFPEKALTGFAERLESFDLRNGRRQAEPVVVTGPLRQFELSPDGARLLATGSAQTPTLVFDARTLHRIGAYAHSPTTPVMWASFARGTDALFLVTRSDDPRSLKGRVITWNPAGGETQSTHEIDRTSPIGVIVTANKTFVAGRELDVLDPGLPDERHISPPTRDPATAVLAISHAGRLVAHAFRYGVQLYDADSGTAVGPLLSADLIPMIDVIAQIAFAPGDDQLLARTLHGAWIIWSIPIDTRAVVSLQQDAALLNAAAGQPLLQDKTLAWSPRDPGAWRAAGARPHPPAAGYVDGRSTPEGNQTANPALEAIPARTQPTSPLLLDLTTMYNFAPDSVGDTMHALVPSLNLFPLGTVRIEGIDYDARGAVQLTDKTSQRFGFSNKMTGLSAPATPIAAFHVLMLAGRFFAEPDGHEQMRMRVHYRDGSSADVAMRSGHELPGDPDEEGPVPFGWVWGDQMRLIGDERQHLLSNPRLPNPHPDRLVATIDIENASDAASAPTLFAITAEPVIAPRDSGTDSPTTPVSTTPNAQPRRNP